MTGKNLEPEKQAQAGYTLARVIEIPRKSNK
jgi:hypothetical protein